MGLITNSGSFSRFQVDSEVPLSKDFMAGLEDMIDRFAFRDMKDDVGQIRSVGWVNIMDMFDNRFVGLEFLKEPYIALSLRVDEKKVPSKTLKRYCLETEERIKADENLDFLHKRRRMDIWDGVMLQLLKRALPGSGVYDMIWNYTTGQVLFAGTGERLCDEFRNIFLKTFELNLISIDSNDIAQKTFEKNACPAGPPKGRVTSEFLGREFLTWLWERVQGNEAFDLGDKTAEIWFDKKLTLIGGDTQDLESITCIGAPNEMKEVRLALDENKKIAQAALLLDIGDNQWKFVLGPALSNFNSFRTPKVLPDKKDDPDGLFYEKVFLIEEAISAIDSIYAKFLAQRLGVPAAEAA